MCGRYYSRREKNEIAAYFRGEVVFKEPLAPNFNIAPTIFQPAIRQSRDGVREMVLMRWGLVPFFASSLAEFKGFSTFNARAESLTTSQTWREPFKKRRCIIPADGFYEWKALSEGKKPKKQPYAISLTDGKPMGFAGLWDAWKEPKPGKESVHTPDTWLQSFSIITTEANEIMSTVYHRMPVILHPRDWDEWLSREEVRPPTHLLRQYESDAMRLEACNQAVGNVKNNGPEMLNSA
jgi:putative SOS response-associated peptidase YedK